MKNTKRWALTAFALLLCLCTVIFSGLSTEAQAATVASGYCGKYPKTETMKWTINSDGVLKISGESYMADYLTDSELSWHRYRSQISSVVINDGVKSVGSEAFRNFADVKKFNLPASVKKIGYYAFYNCTNLKSVRILNKKCEITDDKHTFDEHVKLIGYYGSTTWDYAQKYNREFESYCKHENTTAHEAIASTCADHGYTAGVFCDDCNWWIEGHEKVVTPHTDVNGDFVCDICSKDSRKIIDKGSCGEGVTWAFLEEGTLKISGKGKMDNYIGYDDDEPTAQPWAEYKDQIVALEVKKGVTGIGRVAFKDYTALSKVELPDGLEVIEDKAFEGCTALTEIILPESVEELKAGAFRAAGLIEADLSAVDGLRKFGTSVFADCKSLTDVKLPSNITAIPQKTFSGCVSLVSVDIPENVTVVDDYAFQDCESLTEIEFPESVTVISSYVFRNCKNLKSFKIHNGVTRIKRYAFASCKSLKSITIPGSVKVIEPKAFKSCSKLSKLTIKPGVEEFQRHVFQNCHSLITVDMPKSVRKINRSVFVGCYALERITIRNTNCTVSSSEETIYPDAEICASVGSKAQAYAEKHDRKFVKLKCDHSNGFESVAIKKATKDENGKSVKECKTCNYVKPDSEATVSRIGTITVLEDTFTYDGKPKIPKVEIKNVKGRVLTEGKDYIVTTYGEPHPGNSYYYINFCGLYEGNEYALYKMLPNATKEITVETKTKTLYIDWESVLGAHGYRVSVYKGSKRIVAEKTSKCTFKVTDLEPGNKYKVKIQAYMYSAMDKAYVFSKVSKSVTVATKPLKVTLNSVTAGTGEATLKWDERNCTSYQIRYSTSESFDTYETVKVIGEESVTKTINSLTSGKTYYFKVRAYKSVDGVKYYGTFSSAMNVKVK